MGGTIVHNILNNKNIQPLFTHLLSSLLLPELMRINRITPSLFGPCSCSSSCDNGHDATQQESVAFER